MNSRESLGVMLFDRPRFVWARDIGDNDIQVGSLRFVDSGLGASIGIYDWLRARDGAIVGVRTNYISDSGAENFRGRIGNFPYVDWQKGNFTVFFSAVREYEPSISADQEFGTHRLLFASDGVLLLTYDVNYLSQIDIEYLSRRLMRDAE